MLLYLPLTTDSAVSDSAVGRLTQQSEIFLATASGRFVNIYKQNADHSLKELFHYPIDSLAVAVRFCRLQDSEVDSLVVLTSKRQVMKFDMVYPVMPKSSSSMLCSEGFSITATLLADFGMDNFEPSPKRFAVGRDGTMALLTGPNQLTITHVKNPAAKLQIPFVMNMEHILVVDDGHIAALSSTSETNKSHLQTITHLWQNFTDDLNEEEIDEMDTETGTLSQESHSFQEDEEDEAESLHMETHPPVEAERISSPRLSLKSFRSLNYEDDMDVKLPNNIQYSDYYEVQEYFELNGRFSHISNLRLNDKCQSILVFGEQRFASFRLGEFLPQYNCSTKYGKVIALTFDGEKTTIMTEKGTTFVVSIKAHGVGEFELQHQEIGSGNLANTIVALNDQSMFYGSNSSNSMVYLRIEDENRPDAFKTKVVQVIKNFAPVVDSCLLHNSSEANALRLLTVSGRGKDTSIRIVDNSATMKLLRKIFSKPAEKVFSLKLWFDYDAIVLVSTSEESLLFNLSGIEATQELRFKILSDETLFAADFPRGFIQITHDTIRLSFFKAASELYTRDYDFPDPIDMATGYGDLNVFLVVLADSVRAYEVNQDDQNLCALKELSRIRFDSYISCIELATFENGEMLVFVGFHEMRSISVLRGPILAQMCSIRLPEGYHPVSMISRRGSLYVSTNRGVCRFDNVRPTSQLAVLAVKLEFEDLYEFCHVYTLSPGIVACNKRREGFIVESKHSHDVYKAVHAYAACGFSGKAVPNGIIVSNEKGIYLACLDSPLKQMRCGESVIKICSQSSSNTVALLASRLDHNPQPLITPNTISRSVPVEQVHHVSREEKRIKTFDDQWNEAPIKEVSTIVMLDAATLIAKCSVQLGPFETAISVTSGFFEKHLSPCYAVLTKLQYSDEQKGQLSMIIVFRLKDQNIEFVEKLEAVFHGNPISIGFRNGFLNARIGDEIHVITLDDSRKLKFSTYFPVGFQLETSLGTTQAELSASSSTSVHMVPLLTDEEFVRGKDEIQSIMDATASSSTICLYGSHFSKNIIAIPYNFDLLEKAEHAKFSDDVPALNAQYHLGCDITSINSTIAIQTRHERMTKLIFGQQFVVGTASGVLGLVIQLSPEFHSIVQRVMRQIVESEEFNRQFGVFRRRFETRQLQSQQTETFCDGELLTLFMRMEHHQIMTILDSVPLQDSDRALLSNQLSTQKLLELLVDFYACCLGFAQDDQLSRELLGSISN